MSINKIHSFLVHPSKHSQYPPDISGTEIPRNGSLYNMLSDIFDRANTECNIEVIFRPDNDNQQNNEFRNLLINYVENPNIENGRTIANNLQKVTTHRSGLGLLFLIEGMINGCHKIVISRFPADQGIIAQEINKDLSVKFIERVFMKNTKAYKSVLYISEAIQGGFWEGKAIDHQISGEREISKYWIYEFLQSDLRTTGPAGTFRLANALRDSIQNAPNIDIKQELINFAGFLRNRNGEVHSVNELLDLYRISEISKSLLKNKFMKPSLLGEAFEFDINEFNKHLKFRLVVLDNGAILSAEDRIFDDIYVKQEIDSSKEIVFTTQGEILDEKIRKSL